MTSLLHIMLSAAPFTLALSLFVETSSWWVRAQAPPGSVGLYVSRSNIYLYGGRFFALAFTSATAFWIENGASPTAIALMIGGSLLFASAVQFVLLHNAWAIRTIMRLIARLLRLPPPEIHPPSSDRRPNRRLLGETALASSIFGFGIGLPLLTAVLVPDYRLSVSYLGQIINSFGTLLILFLVDQRLFTSLDRGQLQDDVLDYSRGRIVGFSGSALVFLALAPIV